MSDKFTPTTWASKIGLYLLPWTDLLFLLIIATTLWCIFVPCWFTSVVHFGAFVGFTYMFFVSRLAYNEDMFAQQKEGKKVDLEDLIKESTEVGEEPHSFLSLEIYGKSFDTKFARIVEDVRELRSEYFQRLIHSGQALAAVVATFAISVVLTLPIHQVVFGIIPVIQYP